MAMRRPWPLRWRTTYETVVTAAAHEPGEMLTAEQRGNVTPAHRHLLESLVPKADASWSEQALWSCLNNLRLGTHAGAEVRVEHAWTDGPYAFCVVYTPPYQPEQRVGLRRQENDTDDDESEPGAAPGHSALLSPMFAEVGADGRWDPIGFGRVVAEFDIGEPLGSANYLLRTDDSGVGWWGALKAQLPSPPVPRPMSDPLGKIQSKNEPIGRGQNNSADRLRKAPDGQDQY